MTARTRQLALEGVAPQAPQPPRPAGVPAWILAQRAGEAFRSAGLTRCTHCRAAILYGLDADLCALSVRADPTPLTLLGEVLALMDGRATYSLVTADGRKLLDIRDEWMIAGTRRWPVLPAHKCGASLVAHIEHIAQRHRYAIPAEPPF